MKIVTGIGLIITAWLIFGINGFLDGRDEAKLETDRVRQRVFYSFIELNCPPHPNEYGRGTCELTYLYNKKILYRYDPQINKVNKTMDANELEKEKSLAPKAPFSEATIKTLVKGSGGSLVKYLDSKAKFKGKGHIAAAAAVITGYPIGYKLGYDRWSPRPESKEAKLILESSEEWQKYEKLFYLRTVERAKEMADGIGDKNESEKRKRLVELSKDEAGKKEDLDAADFKILDRNYKEIASLVPPDVQSKQVKSEENIKSLSGIWLWLIGLGWQNLLWLVIAPVVFIILGGLAVFWERRSQKANNKANNNENETQTIRLPTKEEREKYSKQTHTLA